MVFRLIIRSTATLVQLRFRPMSLEVLVGLPFPLWFTIIIGFTEAAFMYCGPVACII